MSASKRTIPASFPELTRILSRVAYIDVVGIVTYVKPTSSLKSHLTPLCGEKPTVHPVERIDPKTGEVIRPPGPPQWLLRLFQPSDDALRVLDAEVFHDPKASRLSILELSLDLTTATVPHARELARWVMRHLIQPNRRQKPMGPTEDAGHNVGYWSKRRWRVKAPAAYGDRPSKMTGDPCAHVEYRFKSAAKVRTLKVRGAAVERPAQLIGFDHRDFWNRHLVLRDIKLDKLGRQLRGRGNAKTPDVKVKSGMTFNFDLRAGQMIARQAGYELGAPVPICAQAVLALAGKLGAELSPGSKFRPDRVLVPIDAEPLLPAPSGYGTRSSNSSPAPTITVTKSPAFSPSTSSSSETGDPAVFTNDATNDADEGDPFEHLKTPEGLCASLGIADPEPDEGQPDRRVKDDADRSTEGVPMRKRPITKRRTP